MKPFTFMRLRARRKSAGVAIVTAIFLLVVVAGLAVAVVSLTTTQQDASAKDLQGMRAYQAARAGIEWALFRGLESGFTPPQPSTSLVCGSSTRVGWPASPSTTLSEFTVTVTIACDPPAIVGGIAGGGGNDPTAFHVTITATACNQPVNQVCPNAAPGADYVQRQITAQL